MHNANHGNVLNEEPYFATGECVNACNTGLAEDGQVF